MWISQLTASPTAEYSELSTKDIRGVYGYQQFIALSLFLGDGLYAVAKVTFVAALGITKHIRERKKLPEHRTERTTFVGRKVSFQSNKAFSCMEGQAVMHQALSAGALLQCQPGTLCTSASCLLCSPLHSLHLLRRSWQTITQSYAAKAL